MQERRQRFHDHQNQQRREQPHPSRDEKEKPGVLGLEREQDHLVEEDGGELRVRQGERPKPEIRRGVADHPQHKLDRVDQLVDEHLREVKLFPMRVMLPALVVALHTRLLLQRALIEV